MSLGFNPAIYPSLFCFLVVILLSCEKEPPSLSRNLADAGNENTVYPTWEHPYLKLADSLQNSGDFTDANLYYREAAEKFSAESKWGLLVKCQTAVAFNLLEQGEIESADSLNLISRSIVDKHLAVDHPGQAALHFTRGLSLYKKNQTDSALFNYLKAAEIFHQYQDPAYFIIKAHNYHRLGDVYMYSLSNYPKAEAFYTKALDLREQAYSGTHFDLLVSYYALSSLSRKKDDIKRAQLYGTNALRIAENLGPEYWFNVSMCYNLLANINHQRAKVTESPEDFQKTLDFYRKAIALFETSEKPSEEILSVYYNNLGAVYKNMHHNDSALSYFRKGLQLKQQGQATDIADSYLNLGWGHTALGNLDSANYYYKKCLDLRTGAQEPIVSDIAMVYKDLGEMYEVFDSLHQSLIFNNKALTLLIPNFSDHRSYEYSTADTIKDIQLTFLTIVNMAGVHNRIYRESGDIENLQEALKLYRFADVLNDYNRNSSIHDESKLFLSNYYQADFEKAVNACYILYNRTKDPFYLNEAFKFIEKDKYVLLFEALTKARLLTEIGVPDSTMRLENDLKTSMSRYQQELELLTKSRQHNQQRAETLNVKILEINRQLERLKNQMISDYPRYYEIQYDSISRNLRTIQSNLRTPNTVLLEYFWGDSAVYAISVTQSETKFIRMSNDPSLESHLQQYLSALIDEKGIQEKMSDFPDFQQSAYHLYATLVAPMLPEAGIEQIVVVPDGPLAFIPLESLLTSAVSANSQDYSQLPYLIRKYQVQYAYSSNLLIHNITVANEKPSVLAVGHSGLQGSSREIRAIAELLPGKVLQGHEATEAGFKNNAGDFNILHLAVHGEGDTGSMLNSKLIFDHSQDSTEDGELNVYELYNMDLKANLAVLSACESGIGKQIHGEGVYSMSRAFTYAGCPSVIMSLWKLNDNYSAAIFSDFYQFIKQGYDSNEALHRAKLEFLESEDRISAHPSTWAALVSVGSSEWKTPWWFSEYVKFVGVALAVSLLLLMGWQLRRFRS